MRYHDGEPSLIEGLLSRGDRRVGAVIERVWRDGGRFDGWSEHFSYERWIAAATPSLRRLGVDLDWFTTRERDGDEVLPWDHLDSGLDKQWLWDDWQDALGEFEQDDCRWTPCFDCGVCPTHGHRHPDRPDRADAAAAGRRLRPARADVNGSPSPEGPPPPPVVQRVRLRYAKRGRLRFTSHRDFARAFERALRRAEVPMAYSAGFTPASRRSPTSARRRPAWPARPSTSRSRCAPAVDPEQLRMRARRGAAGRAGHRRGGRSAGAGSLAERMQASHWRIELPGCHGEASSQAAVDGVPGRDRGAGRAADQGRAAQLDARAPVVSVAVSTGPTVETAQRVRYWTWSCGR